MVRAVMTRTRLLLTVTQTHPLGEISDITLTLSHRPQTSPLTTTAQE